MDLPDDVRAVIALFEKQLAKVSFPEIDAGVLRRQADEVRADAAIVARARAALDEVLAAGETKLAALRETARRATAYATIYSEAHPERRDLAEALAALTVPVPGVQPTSAKRRGRPRKHNVELFAVPDPTAATS